MSEEDTPPKQNIQKGFNVFGRIQYAFEMGRDLLTGENRTGEEFIGAPVDADGVRKAFGKIKEFGGDRVDDAKNALKTRATLAEGITDEDVQNMRTVDEELAKNINALGDGEQKRFNDMRNMLRLALASNYPMSLNEASQRGAGFDKITDVMLRDGNLGDAIEAFKGGGSEYMYLANSYFKQLGEDANEKGVVGTAGTIFASIGGFFKGAFNFIKDWMSEGLEVATANFQKNVIGAGKDVTKDVFKRDINERLDNIHNDLVAEGFSVSKADAVVEIMKKQINTTLARDSKVPFKELFTAEEIVAHKPKVEQPQTAKAEAQSEQGKEGALDEPLSAPQTPAPAKSAESPTTDQVAARG
jgi:hypothetical protein